MKMVEFLLQTVIIGNKGYKKITKCNMVTFVFNLLSLI